MTCYSHVAIWCCSVVMWYESVNDDIVQPCGDVVLQCSNVV